MNVVSFYAPRPDHPLFQDYTPFLRILDESCKRFGHRHIVLTDVDLPGFEHIKMHLPHNLMLAFVMAQRMYLESFHAETDTLLTGADCVLARDPAGIFANGEFDIACTTHPFADSILNTGAIFVRGGSRVSRFWKRAEAMNPAEWGDDQRVLRDALGATLDHGLHLRGGVRVRFLPLHPWNVAPDNPGDPPGDAVILHFRGPRKQWMQHYCAAYLGIGEPPDLQPEPNTSLEGFFANIDQNSRLDFPFLTLSEPHGRDAVLVGGGPSIKDDVELVRWRQQNGATVFAMNGAATWLLKQGIEADWLVMADARPENVRFLRGYPAKGYLISSQCSPILFEGLPKDRTIVWHIGVDGVENHIHRDGMHALVGGGVTTGLCALVLAEIMGHRTLHLYGFDSSDREGQAHAYEQHETDEEKMRFTVWCNGREFVCSAAMYAQAMRFKVLAPQMADKGITINVSGDGLLPHMARSMQGAARQEIAA